MDLPTQHSFKVFFSWQSDVPAVHVAMRKMICEANEAVSRTLHVEVAYDEATRDVPGSPDIEKCLMEKIFQCDVFVADITPLAWKSTLNKKKDDEAKNEKDDIKLMPNPNVLYELGLAVAIKGWDNIVLLRKKDDNNYKDLPFDINHHRTDVIDVDKNKNLTDHILAPIKTILKNQYRDYPLFFDTIRLDINIRSEKYIPEVYVDSYDYRQCIRLFVDPYSFYAKEMSELSKFNFDILNAGYKRQGKPLFVYDLGDLPVDINTLSFLEAYGVFTSLVSTLDSRIETLSQDGNAGYINSSKLRRRRDRYDYLNNLILMVRSVAGQGKTNLICDLVDNILLKRKIPFLWINGGEINPSDFENSFLHKVLHDRYNSFHNGVEDIARLCYRTHKPLIVIIDGVNEIPYDVNLCHNLNQFLISLLKYKYVKVILTCREEYYKAYFSEYLLDDCTVIKKRLNEISHDEGKRSALLRAYCKHFDISLSVDAEDEEYLTSNMLFLRIFCNVNRGKEIKQIDRCKYALFNAYYDKSLSRIASQLNSGTGRRITKYDVEAIYDTIVSLMIERNEQFNLPIDILRNKLDSQTKDIIERFLDENILVKRDISKSKEVVSFTYDEFRDFLKAKYLVQNILPSSVDGFNKAIDNSSDKSISEGLLPFLLIDIYESKNEEAKAIIKSKEWFVNVFALNIWNVSDDNIHDEDVKYLEECMRLYPKRITNELIYRWDCKKYHKINIGWLLNYVSSLDDQSLDSYIQAVFPISEKTSYYYIENYTFRDWFLDSLDNILKSKTNIHQKDLKYIFELALILTPVSSKAIKMIDLYIEETKDRSIVSDLNSKTVSKNLKSALSRWI